MPVRVLAPSVFLLSTAVLAFEILLLRIFAIETFHHFAHMAIGIALLGSGASGTLLVVAGPRLRGREPTAFAVLCALTALALVAAPALSHGMLVQREVAASDRPLSALIALYLVLTLPFLTSGAAMAIALQLAVARVGHVYAWGLVGSATGTGLSLLLLSAFAPARAVAVCAIPAGAAAFVAIAGLGPRRRWAGAFMAAATMGVIAAAVYRPPWQPGVAPDKDLARAEAVPGAKRVAEDWSAAGWVAAVRVPGLIHAPGISLAYRGTPPGQIALFVDAEGVGAATLHDGDPAGVEFVHWLPATAVHAATDTADSVLVLGAAGGLDVLVALARGARSVTAIEPVGALSRVVEAALPAAARVYADPRVRLVTGDARAFVASTDAQYDVIVLPPSGTVDRSRSVADIGEDYVHTVEAYAAYVHRLAPGGVLAITRWRRTPPGEDLRVILTAGEALRSIGVAPTSRRLVFLRSWATGTLLVKPDGFTDDELARLDAFAAERFFDIDRPIGGDLVEPEHHVLARPIYEHALRAVSAGNVEAAAFARDYPLDIAPATDDRPYFGNTARRAGAPVDGSEGERVAATSTLVQSSAAAVLLLVPPLIVLARRRTRRRPAFRPLPVAAYFAAIGFGFVFVEIAAIQRLALVLGHPVLAAAATIAALLAFSGVGSALSDRWRAATCARACLAVAIAAGVIAATASWTGALNALPFAGRAAAALVLVALPGIALGVPFPMGLRRLAGGGDGVAWAWASNGVASVVGASLAALIALALGGRALIAIGALCYVAAAAIARATPTPHHGER